MKKKDERLSEVLELVNLIKYKERYPYELSGGQQQRVALARAIAPKPSVILLDELKKILSKTGITSIFVTHDKDDAISIANKVVILKDGEIVQYGSPKEILYNPKSQYIDYLHLAKVNDKWKIINVLWDLKEMKINRNCTIRSMNFGESRVIPRKPSSIFDI